MSILRVSGLTADGKALLQLEQRVRVEPSNGPTSNLRVPTRTQPQGSPTNPGDIKEGRVRDTYDTASHRLSRATNALRGEEDSQILGKAVALAIGVGIGVGIGLLIAPASGEKTRADIADKVTDFSDKVRENVGKKPQSATGTHGE